LSQADRWQAGRIAISRGVTKMGASQLTDGHARSFPPHQVMYEPHSERSSLVMVTGFLDAALRMWDEDHTKAKSQIKVAMAMLCDCTDEPPNGHSDLVASPATRGLAPWQARKVKELIEASLHSTIRLPDCARKARLSASYFSRAFKATFGSTVCDYIRRRRVERAQRLMLLSKESLSQIALACGFADQAHYCRVFRSVVGLSPSVWRRHNMNLAPDE
jgi:AraC family transcriptional regulator